MDSLILLLFLGATVALAEIHVENDPYREHYHSPMLKECMEKCGMKPTMPGELADEENDPHGHHHHHPSLPPEVKKCMKKCLEEHKPSKPPTESGMKADEINDPRRPRPSGVSPRPRPSGHAHVFIKCMKKCLEEHKPSKPPIEPGMEADEINDPRRPGVSPRPPRPSGHAHVFRKCMKECLEEHKPSKPPTEPGMEADEIDDPRRPRPSGVSPRPPRPSGVSPRPRPSGHAHVFRECMRKCLGENPTIPGKLADEENDPHHHHHPSFSPDVRKCIHECLEEHKPSKLPPPPTEPGKVADEDKECIYIPETGTQLCD